MAKVLATRSTTVAMMPKPLQSFKQLLSISAADEIQSSEETES